MDAVTWLLLFIVVLLGSLCAADIVGGLLAGTYNYMKSYVKWRDK